MPTRLSMTKSVRMKNNCIQVFKDHSIKMSYIKYMAGVVITAMAISSCDEDVMSIGSSLTNESDTLNLSRSVYQATSQTVIAKSVLTDPQDFFFGRVSDPQTNTIVTSDFTSQFYVLPSLDIPSADYFVYKEDGKVIADSCDIIIYTKAPANALDNLTAMQMRIRELQTPIPSGRYYSDFNPEDYVRKDANAIDFTHVFTYTNLRDTESERSNTDYLNNIRLVLNKPYKGRDSIIYKNYGTYILRQYMEHKERFRNSNTFARDVCPGFLFEITDGLGFYAAMSNIGLRVWYTLNRDKVYQTSQVFAGTEEVVQTVRVINDKTALTKLAAETDHTYLKTPAGLFTEVTLPVENIWNGHENDSLLAAKIIFQRLNNSNVSERDFEAPSALLMVMKDSLNTFFEQRMLPNSQTSFFTTFTSSSNIYSFANISTLITHMWARRKAAIKQIQTAHPGWTLEQATNEWVNQKDTNGNLVNQNWNKVILVPASYEVSSTSSAVTRIGHDMSLTSTRLIGGKNNPISFEVVYGRFNH